jgi:hypothetical protein
MNTLWNQERTLKPQINTDEPRYKIIKISEYTKKSLILVSSDIKNFSCRVYPCASVVNILEAIV